MHSTPRFLLLLAALSCGLPAHAQDPARSNLIEVPLVGQSINFYSILLPPDYNDPAQARTTYPVCVMVHGAGSRDDQYVDLVDNHLKREGVIYLCPRAPYLLYSETIRQGLPAYTAFPEFPPGSPADLAPDGAQLEHLYTDWIAHCVADARTHYRIQPGKFALIGHSQGAACGFLFTLDHPDLVKAAFLAEGFYSSVLGDDTAARILKKHDIHLTIVHNQDDPVAPFSEGQGLVDYLEKNNVPADHTFYPTGQHNITDPCKDLSAAYVEKWCRQK